MKSNFLKALIFVLISTFASSEVAGQNRNFMVNLSLGAGNSGFKIDETGQGEVKRIFYPMGGIQIQKRISSKWAINIFPNVGMSGNRVVLPNPIGNTTEVKSTSAFINLALHPKYYFNNSAYFSFGPEISYLLWNYGSTYNKEDDRLSNLKETAFFNRTNLLVSSSLGISMKVGESRKKAPVQIDALWYLEFRLKKGLTNILNKEIFGNEASSSISSFELVTGFSFASKK
ncbi:MAG: outer membrane beta-barrel protein [Chitinophagales bacterium]